MKAPPGMKTIIITLTSVIATGALIRVGELFARADAAPFFYGIAMSIAGVIVGVMAAMEEATKS